MRIYWWAVSLFVFALLPIASVAQNSGPTIFPDGILNASSLASTPANIAAPGSIVSIFGKNLATGVASSTASPLPLNINGTIVKVGNFFAPLLFVSPTQINAQIPFEVSSGANLDVSVWINSDQSAPQQLHISATAPGIFTVSGTGSGPARILHADSTLVSAASPALPGETVQILCTGLGLTLGSATAPVLVTGKPGGGQQTVNVPVVTVGGIAANVISAIAAPGRVGEYVIRIVVPSVSSGDQPIVVLAGANPSQSVATVAVGTPPPPPPPPPPSSTQPVIFSGRIFNAASFDPTSNNTAAPGSLISILGINLATATRAAGAPPLPLSLSGTSVLIGGFTAPLLMVSSTQINAQVPFEVQPGSSANVVVVVNGQSSALEPLKIVAAGPGIFTLTGNGVGSASAFHADGTAVTVSSPALPGQVVSILATGLGSTLSTADLPSVKTGQVGSGQLTVLTPAVTVGGSSGTFSTTGSPGVSALVLSSVAAGDQAGEYLISFLMPDIPVGDQLITVTAGGNASGPFVTLRVGFPSATLLSNFTQLHLTAQYNAIFSFPVTVKIDDPSDPTKRIDAESKAIFDRTLPCNVDLAGSGGSQYTAVIECKGVILGNGLPDPSNLAAIKIWLQNGNFLNNEIIFPSLLVNPEANSFFFLNAVGPITIVGAHQTPTALLVSEGNPITSAVMSIDFNDLSQGSPVVGTIHLLVADPLKTPIGGTFTGVINNVQ